MNVLRKEPRRIRRRFPYFEPAPDVAARTGGAGALRDESFCLPEDRPQHGDHPVVQLFRLSFDFGDHKYSHFIDLLDPHSSAAARSQSRANGKNSVRTVYGA